MTPITIQPWFSGRTVAILASGPTMSRRVAERVRSAGIPAIAVNSTVSLAPWAGTLYAADVEWWTHPLHRHLLDGYQGLRLSCQPVAGVHTLRIAGLVGYSDNLDCVHTYGNSGLQAVQVAAKAGASVILLCGFDMRGGHWHGAHPSGLRDTTEDTYALWVNRAPTLAMALAERGVAVVNCTPGSALDAFPSANLERMLDLHGRHQDAAATEP